MNITPTLPNPHYDTSRTRGTVEAVQPVERAREPASRQEAGELSPQSAVEVLEREALLDAYSQANSRLQDDRLARHSRRAVSAYNDVALVQKRDLLTDVLGVNEYA